MTLSKMLGIPTEQIATFGDMPNDMSMFTKVACSLPGLDFVDRVISLSDRNNRVLVNLQRIFQRGRRGGTGYVSKAACHVT